MEGGWLLEASRAAGPGAGLLASATAWFFLDRTLQIQSPRKGARRVVTNLQLTIQSGFKTMQKPADPDGASCSENQLRELHRMVNTHGTW